MTLHARHGTHGPSELVRLRAENERYQREIQRLAHDIGARVGEIERLRSALTKIRDTRLMDGYHTRQAQALQGIAAMALGDQ